MTRLNPLACASLLTTLVWMSFSAWGGSFEGLTYSTSTSIKVGEWNTNFSEAKDYAEKHDLPLVVFWARSVCGYCKGLAANLSSQSVRTWMKSSGCVFAFGKDYSENGQKTYDFARYGGTSTPVGNYFPYCRVYWKSKKVNYGFCGREKNGKIANSVSAFVLSSNLFMSTVKKQIAVIPLNVTSDTAVCTVSGGGKYRVNTKVTLKAKAASKYVFSGWYEKSKLLSQKPSYALTVGSEEISIVGKFILKTNDWAKIEFSLPAELARGSAVEYPVSRSGGSAFTVSFSGLPKGLAYSSGNLKGTPSKSGFYTLTGKVKTATGTTVSQKSAVTVRGVGESTLRVKSNDTSLGTVSGSIVALPGKSRTLKATPKKNRLFAGWYADDGCQTLLTRKASWKTTVPGTDTVYYGRFVTKTADKEAQRLAVGGVPVETSLSITNTYWRGVAMELPVSSEAILATTVTASTLPAGLSLKKITTGEYKICGTPTTAKTYATTLKVSSGGGSLSRKIVFVIKPQPTWAVGTFEGYAAFDEATGRGAGRASMTIASSGSTSGKFALGGTNWTFSAKGYAVALTTKPRELDWSFTLTATATYKSFKRPLTLVVKSGQFVNCMTCSDAVGGGEDFALDLLRNIWKDSLDLPARPIGSFSLDPDYYPSGVSVQLSAKTTTAKFAGRLTDGTSVSCTSTLFYDPRYETYAAFLIIPATKTYPGGLYEVDLGKGE